MDLKIFENKRVVIAVSTGVDSMVLLEKMLQVNCEVYVVYVRHHHRVRVGLESDFFVKYCQDRKINLTTYDYHHSTGNFESQARDYRYKCFYEVYVKYNCDYLLTAHHGDDLVETIMMRQLRGTDIKGIGGFREFSFMNGMNVARPLLRYSKKQLREIAKNAKIIYYEDETNADTSYQRNFLRHEIIPKFNEGYINKFVNLSKEMYELSDYINEMVDKSVSVLNDIYLNTNNLDVRLHKYGIKQALFYLYGNDIKIVYDKHVKLILSLDVDDKLQLPKGYFAFKKSDCIVFSKVVEEKYRIKVTGDIIVPFLNSKIVFNSQGTQVLRFDDRVKFPLYVTNADLSKKIKCKSGTQKLNRVFIDNKISRHKRSSWPMLVDSSGEVLCVFGIKYSVFCLKDTMDYNFMLKYMCIYGGDDYNA